MCRGSSVQSEKNMQMRQVLCACPNGAVSLWSSLASKDIQKLNKVEGSMNN